MINSSSYFIIEILQRIIESCGTKIINCKDFDGRESTPLHFAAGYNRVEVLKYLLEKDANVEARDTGFEIQIWCLYVGLVNFSTI